MLIVAATVVAAFFLLNSDSAILCNETFSTFFVLANISMSSLSKPIFIIPLIIPIVAAMLPLFSTALMDSFATLILSG